ncbi:hypothetical protein NOM01_03410 [Sporolactobacillus sp. STSJ-5]|uniref:hypothetical protein n=1 Tax=Sporolactobacillus sp. STSJ-5 TaxID=2965076 RepID=UPI0021033261|nr:hypothetical protein [Sporolactobacillus sp. STSJ-5]MCQ2009041.1 hypothetical protein [Sporolactobacillus sp. STSJ-5]
MINLLEFGETTYVLKQRGKGKGVKDKSFNMSQGVETMKNDVIHCGGTLTWREFKKYNFYVRKKLFTVTSISFFIILLLINLILFQKLLISFTMAAAFTVVFCLLLMIIFPLRIRNEYSSNQLIKQEIQYEVNQNEIVQTRGKSKTFFKWEDYNGPKN